MFFPLRDHNPTQRLPVVTMALIAANVVVFAVEVFQGNQLGIFLARWGATPYELTHGVDLVGALEGTPLVHVEGPRPLWITTVSSMFLHGGWLHLTFNMWFLWIFGNNVEDFLGRLRFLLFYLLTGLAGLAIHVAIAPNSILPTVGASGAVSGMLGAYLVLFPRARITSVLFLGFFFQFLEVPAILLIGLWTGIQVLGGLAGLMVKGESGGVAYWAHVGGFAAGWLGIRWFYRKRLADSIWRNRWRQLGGRYDDQY